MSESNEELSEVPAKQTQSETEPCTSSNKNSNLNKQIASTSSTGLNNADSQNRNSKTTLLESHLSACVENKMDNNETSSNVVTKSENESCPVTPVSDSSFSSTSSCSSSSGTSTKSSSSNSLKRLRLVPEPCGTSFSSTGNTAELRAFRIIDTDENDDQYFQFVPTIFVPDDSKFKRKKGSTKKQSSLDNKNYVLKRNLEREWSYLIEKRESNLSINKSRNLVSCLNNIIIGNTPPKWQRLSINNPIINNIVKHMRVHRACCSFSRRVTSVTWHPFDPKVVAAGSKGGDIVLWNYEVDGGKPRVEIKGRGQGGSIQQILFDETSNGYQAYTVSIDGTLSIHDFLNKTKKPYLESEDVNIWYTSLDISVSGKVIVVGDNRGFVNQLTLDGENLWRHRLHDQKVTHIEFSPRAPWCLVTASVDRTVKVWDVRNMKDKKTCLHTLSHDKPVNSAHFSRTDGGRLLTTDQYSQIRIYECPSFAKPLIIPHPHRQFQHLTPIRATWHPLQDIAVIGRYPDPSFPGYYESEPRTVDFFDGSTGQLLHKHQDPEVGKYIVALNLFSPSGDRMVSGAGVDCWVWKPNYDSLTDTEDYEETVDDDDEDDFRGESKRRRH